MYFEDLTPLHYGAGPFDAANWRTPLLAVGWLEHPHPYLKGVQPSGFEMKIQRMFKQAKASHAHETFRGLHRCSLCEAEGCPGDGLPDSHHNLFVPGTGVIYVAPADIMHYLRSHLYRPADDFVTAVERCPNYGTPAYFAALKTANNEYETPFEIQEKEFRTWRESSQKSVQARRPRSP